MGFGGGQGGGGGHGGTGNKCVMSSKMSGGGVDTFPSPSLMGGNVRRQLLDG